MFFKLSPALLVFIAFLSCSAPPVVSSEAEDLAFIPVEEILPAALGPERQMDRILRLDHESHLEILENNRWKSLRGAGLPTRVVYPNPEPELRPLNSFSQGKDGFWAATTPLGLFISRDFGETWKEVLKREVLAKYAYLTSVSLSIFDEKVLALGTSFHGAQLSQDGGKNWTDLSPLVASSAPGTANVESVHAVELSKADPDILWVSLGIGPSLWKINTKTKKAASVAMEPLTKVNEIDRILSLMEGDQEILEIRTKDRYWRYETLAAHWVDLGPRPTELKPLSEAKKNRMEKSKDKYGIYISSFHASDKRRLENHLDFMEKNGFNALVVDFKDDFGDVTYKSQVELAQKAKAIKNRIDVPGLVKAAHDRGFYLIARVVVFKDERLFKYNNNQFALWDYSKNKTKGQPWGYYHRVETPAPEPQVDPNNPDAELKPSPPQVSWVQKEFWVDTYSEEVWDYNIALSKELEGLGVDEIQFDYIRFPSDGPTGNISHRFAVSGMSRMDALESFLKKARENIGIPIGVDIYGFNGWYLMDYLGQNAEMLSKYVDSISPMFYPSHFPAPFLGKLDFLSRSFRIYQEGSNRTWLMTHGRIHVRPYIQAFLIGGETKFKTPYYTSYLLRQVEGSLDSKASGFLLWNASNRYYMVTQSLEPYTKVQEKAKETQPLLSPAMTQAIPAGGN